MTRCIARCAFSALSSAVALALTLAGCRDAPTLTPAPSAERRATDTRATATWAFPLSVHPDLPELTVVIDGEVPDAGDQVSIRTVTVRSSATDETVQILEGFSAGPSASTLDSGAAFQVLDMNFDGYGDFRLLEIAPAGPNVRYLNWLYRPESATFASSAALDALVAPRFDPETEEVISSRREEPSRYVTETYRYSEGGLVLTRRAVREYTEPGRYTLTVSEPHGQGMEIVERRMVNENQP